MKESTTSVPAFDTVVDALSWLTAQGFNFDFIRNSKQTDSFIATTNDFTLDYRFRFEGQTDPADEHIIYAIRSEKHGIKGIVLSAFGVYADTDADDLVSRLLPHDSTNFFAKA